MSKGKQRMSDIKGYPPLILDVITDATRQQRMVDAGVNLFRLISLAHSRLSRARLSDYAHDLAADMMDNATLEEIRAWCMRLEEDMGL